VRRAIPWALVGLLGIGVAVGAALGAANSPNTVQVQSASPTQAEWVAHVLATTRAAGTAHLTFGEVTASANPDLRGSSLGSGTVNFAVGTVRTTEVQHQIDWSIAPGGAITPHPQTESETEIGVGSTLYVSNGWLQSGLGFTRLSHAPRAASVLGLRGTAAAPLFALSPPFAVVSVRNLGPAWLDGTATTSYEVRTRLHHDCPTPAATRAPHATMLAAPTAQTTTMWVDGKGRLVQARSSVYNSGNIPAASLKSDPWANDRPQGSTILTTTVRLSAFGAPVTIAAPNAVIQAPYSTSVAVTMHCSA
jgi:hypothetical protein